MNAFKLSWKYCYIWVIFTTYMKVVFAITGKLISASGFEDIDFQAGICSSGSLNGMCHFRITLSQLDNPRIVSEALERLLFKRFLTTINDSSIPDISSRAF